MKELLSICIPTYNGAKYIEKNLDVIVSQIQDDKLDGVEVVVSDNCSTDSVPEIMSKYVEKYPNIIRYSRNDVNLGYDGNVMKLCKLAKGKFIHLFGDDDYFAPNGLKRLVDVLKSNPDLSVLILSNCFLQEDNYGCIRTRKNINDIFHEKDKLYTNNSDQFIIDMEDRAWPNTNVVFKKQYFEQIPNIEHFFKKDWIHIYIMLYIAQKWQNCYLFADKYPIVICRVGVQTWLNNIDGPRIYFNNLYTYSFADKLGYDKKVFSWYRKKLLFEYIKNIRFRRSKNIFTNIRYLCKYFPYYKDCPNFYFKFIPKFLGISLQKVFSIKNIRTAEEKKKIFTFLGLVFVIKKAKIPKLRIQETWEVMDDTGFYQYVSGSVYSQMLQGLKELEKKGFSYFKFYAQIEESYNSKQVEYQKYLDQESFYQNIVCNEKRAEAKYSKHLEKNVN